jgi:hypothetical protein
MPTTPIACSPVNRSSAPILAPSLRQLFLHGNKIYVALQNNA